MPLAGPYFEAYPRGGNVALLCEGDVIGYEASVLRRWADAKLKNDPLVDLWPCGTATSIFGMSDAIGRSRPIMAIEDRDFRTLDEAAKECAGAKADRESRGVRVLAWRAWRRSEIENYFLEPEVVLPVMAEVFGCSQDDVRQGLTEVVRTLAVYQAVQYALYRARRSWKESDPTPVLPNNLECRPIWDDGSCRPIAPVRENVRARLETNVQEWQTRFASAPEAHAPPRGKDVLRDFDSKCDEWQTIGWGDAAWRMDWTGKEILHWLRLLLTARFGWYERDTSARVKIQWQGLSRSRREARDREIESALRPMMVAKFVNYITTLNGGEVYDEFLQIENSLRGYNPAPVGR
jgi:hypothetical protein